MAKFPFWVLSRLKSYFSPNLECDVVTQCCQASSLKVNSAWKEITA